MNRLLLAFALAASSLLAACVQPAPFTVILDNPGEETRYVQSFGSIINLSREVDGEWQAVSEDRTLMCAAVCGQPGQVVCAAIALIPTVFALLPGDQVEFEFDGDGWVFNSSGQCIHPISHAGPARIEACHSTEAFDPAQQPIEEPTESGTLVDAVVVDPICSQVEVEIEAGSEVTLELVPAE